MLIELDIQNLGVIANAHLPFSSGFTVLTGETGAGKTMVLNALSLLMGRRADPNLIRQGCEQLAIEGRWDTTDWPDVSVRVREIGGDIDDDGTVIATRLVTPARSKALLGGRAVPQGTMAEFTHSLITVHGQSDQIRLRTPSRQRAALDDYGSAAFPRGQYSDVIAKYRELWEHQGRLQARFDTLTNAAAERAREAELLKLSLTDVERVQPQVGEHADLTAQVARLANVESLRLAVGSAYQALTDSEGEAGTAITLIEAARRSLAQAAGDDASLIPLAERAAEAGYLVGDLGSDLAGYLDNLDADPEQLEALQTRLGELNGLARRLAMPPADVTTWADAAALRLLELDNDNSAIGQLSDQLAATQGALAQAAVELTGARTTAAGGLARAATSELIGLGMKDAALQITIATGELGPTGGDLVEFLLVPHRGAPPTPVAKGASGGELSRVMLALELTLATAAHASALAADGSAGLETATETDSLSPVVEAGGSPGLETTTITLPLPTFVFDEIDAGVGGKAALEVGRRLAQLAELTQVIVVTHLPQVAAFADQHLVVQKTAGETEVTVVSGASREREIARMLAGTDTSATAISHAQELLASARSS